VFQAPDRQRVIERCRSSGLERTQGRLAGGCVRTFFQGTAL